MKKKQCIETDWLTLSQMCEYAILFAKEQLKNTNDAMTIAILAKKIQQICYDSQFYITIETSD